MDRGAEYDILMSAVLGAAVPELSALSGGLGTISRAELAQTGGLTAYGGHRDIYKALGYYSNATFDRYNKLYMRGDIARAVVNAYPDESWRLRPYVTEDGNEVADTDFEQKWQSLSRELNIYRHLHKADRISGVGSYGVVWLGFDDGKKPSTELGTGKHNLIFLRPFHEGDAKILSFETSTASPRYGLPTSYSLGVTQPRPGGTTDSVAPSVSPVQVHHSRVIHIAEDTVSNDVYGTPRLMPVLNRLLSLELLAGGSAEMYWRGALPGYKVKIDPDVQMDESDLDVARDQISKFVHNLQRYIRLRGMDVQSISPQVVDPSKQVEVQLMLISAAKGIPKRILSGSERGELASSQDETSWTKLVEARRLNYVEPCILRPLIEKLILAGALPKPKDGYSIAWPDLRESTPKDRAEIEKIRADALSSYTTSPDAQMIIPPEMFLRAIMGFSTQDVEKFNNALRDALIKDREDRQETTAPSTRTGDGGSATPAPVPPPDTQDTTDSEGSE
jgi:hypothetical protein